MYLRAQKPGERQVAIMVADTIKHSFDLNGKQIQILLGGYSQNAWYSLVALKMKCVT